MANAKQQSDQDRYFEYLDRLRESGATNMLGATPYLQANFDMDQETASNVLWAWIDSFDERHPQ